MINAQEYNLWIKGYFTFPLKRNSTSRIAESLVHSNNTRMNQFLHYSPIFAIVTLFYFYHSSRWIVISHCDINFISLIENDAECLFRWSPCSAKCLFMPLVHFFIGFHSVLILVCNSDLSKICFGIYSCDYFILTLLPCIHPSRSNYYFEISGNYFLYSFIYVMKYDSIVSLCIFLNFY